MSAFKCLNISRNRKLTNLLTINIWPYISWALHAANLSYFTSLVCQLFYSAYWQFHISFLFKPLVFSNFHFSVDDLASQLLEKMQTMSQDLHYLYLYILLLSKWHLLLTTRSSSPGMPTCMVCRCQGHQERHNSHKHWKEQHFTHTEKRQQDQSQ